MKPYLFKTPSLVAKLFPSLFWEIEEESNGIYLTFDDGPTPEVTPYVLDLLEKFNAKATFFCIGKNILAHPDIFKDILSRGHRVGNHTFNHLNARKADTETYLKEVEETEQAIRSFEDSDSKHLPRLFRPPYGRITPTVTKALTREQYRIIMWSVLSADFDRKLDTQKSLRNLKSNSKKGNIIVFHDSLKAYDNLRILLPEYLEFLKKESIAMKSL